MRTSTVVILAFSTLLLTTSITAKAQLQSGFHYKIKNNYKPLGKFGKTYAPAIYYGKRVKGDNTTFTPEKRILNTDKRKARVKQQGDSLLIEFWSVANTISASSTGDRYVTGDDLVGQHDKATYAYFMQIRRRKKLAEPVAYISLPYVTTELGVATVPFKFRRGNTSKVSSNQLLADISLGPYIGRKWGRTRFYTDKDQNHNSAAFTIGLMIAPTVISIDSTNTRKEVTSKSDEMGITTAIATMYSYRDFNVGMYLGADHPVTGKSDKWVYANKLWIGFGVGYKINILGAGK